MIVSLLHLSLFLFSLSPPGYRCPTAVDFLSTDPNLLVVSYSAAKTVVYDIETAKPVVNLDSGTTYGRSCDARGMVT